MDQEAEAMKNKKALWPWAKRMVMGETKASRRHTAGSKNTNAGFRDDTEPSYDSRPIEINEWFHTFMCMNIPIYGWFYLKKLAHQQSTTKYRTLQELICTIKWSFLQYHW